MKKYLLSLLFILIISVCYAGNYGRVCIEKSTGKMIEFQLGDEPLGKLTKNAVNAGYNANDVEEKYLSQAEWQVIEYEQVKKPAEDKIKEKKDKQKIKRDEVKAEFGWTEAQMQK